MPDLLDLAWERNLPAVRIRHPQLTDADMRVLRELGAYPLASGDIVFTPQTILTIVRRLEALEARIGAPLACERSGDPGAGAAVGGRKPRKKGG